MGSAGSGNNAQLCFLDFKSGKNTDSLSSSSLTPPLKGETRGGFSIRRGGGVVGCNSSPLPNSVPFTHFCSCAGCHRHRQVQLLPEVRVPRAPQPCGGPHQLRALADIQQLHFRVGSILTRAVNSAGGNKKKKKNELSVLCCSPSICHSDSDLSEGSRKYSPSSETSLETQRACGKAQTWRTHSHASKKNASSILYQAVSHRNGRSFIWTNNSLRSLRLFSFAEGSSCSHLCVPFFFFFDFCLLFCLFLPPASLRRLLRDVLGSLRL